MRMSVFFFFGKRLHDLEDRGDVLRQKRAHETRNVLGEVSESVRRYQAPKVQATAMMATELRPRMALVCIVSLDRVRGRR